MTERVTRPLYLGSALCGLIAGLALIAGSAQAQEASGTLPGLNWVRLQGAQDCLSAAQLAERVEQRVGRGLFAATTEAEIFVDGSVRATQSQARLRVFEVTLQVSRRGGEVLGERVLSIEGESCSVIDEAVSLVIGVTLYPQSSLVAIGIPLEPGTAASLRALFGDEPTDPDPATLPSPPQAPIKSAAPERPRKETAASMPHRPGVQLGLDAVASAGLGQLPGLRFALGGYVRLDATGLFPVEIGAAHCLARHTPVARGVGSVAFDLTTVTLAACPWQLWVRELRACVGLEGGILHAAPHGLAQTAPPSRDAVINGLIGAVYRPRLLGPLHLRLGLSATVPFAQRAFVYRADGGPKTLFRTSTVQGRADFGLGIDL